MFCEDTMDADAPRFESRDGRCKYVDQQGQHHLSHLGVAQNDVEGNIHLDCPSGKEDLDGTRHYDYQVND
jgi:hypothetical protein